MRQLIYYRNEQKVCFYIIHLQILHQYGILLLLKIRSKDALLVNNMYGHSEQYEVFWYSLEKNDVLYL